MSDPKQPPALDTPDKMRAAADRLEREAAEILEEARREADPLLARASQLRLSAIDIERWRKIKPDTAIRAMGPLTTVSINDMRIDTMSSTDTPKVSGPKFTSRHPLPIRAKALGKSIPDVAAEVTKALKRNVPRTTVRSWYAPKGSESARAIPADAVKFFEADPWGIPRDAWKNGIKDAD